MSFTAETRERSRPAVPLAPMVDVLFLLLIFFMTASVFREQEQSIPIALPETQTAEAGVGGTQITVSFTDDGRLYLGQTEMTRPELREALVELHESNPDAPVMIRGGAGRWDLGIELVDLAQQAGFDAVEAAAVGAEN